MDPVGLKFTRSHEWLHVEGKQGTIGLSEFAVEHLTDITWVELPDEGAVFEAGDAFGEVENTKGVNEIYMPVAGKVTEVNRALEDEITTLSDDPYGDGWLIKVRIEDRAAVDDLLDKAAYDDHCESEES